MERLRLVGLIEYAGEDVIFIGEFERALRGAKARLGSRVLRRLETFIEGSWFPYPAMGRLLSHLLALLLGGFLDRFL
jgi:hypothetical protein